MIFALRKFRVYLLSTTHFRLITDHDALRYTFQKKNVYGRIARWIDFLAEYEFEITHRKGKANLVPDFLSRLEGDAPKDEDLDEGDLVCAISESEEYETSIRNV